MQTIHELILTYGQGSSSYFNICLTNGQRMLATRYTTAPNEEPSSMHYLINKDFVLVASEKLPTFKGNWQTVPKNNLIMVHEDKAVELHSIH